MTVGLTPRNPSTAPPLQILLLVIEFNRTLTLVGPLCSYAHATTFTTGNNNWYNRREVADHDFSLLNQDLPRLRDCIFRHLNQIWNELHSPNVAFSFEELLPSPSRGGMKSEVMLAGLLLTGTKPGLSQISLWQFKFEFFKVLASNNTTHVRAQRHHKIFLFQTRILGGSWSGVIAMR